MRRKKAEPAPPPSAPEPAVPPGASAEPAKVEAVTVAPSLAATGSEEFNTGKGLFEAPAEKPGEDGSEANGAMSPHLLTYPFVAIFDLAATVRQWDGWRLDNGADHGEEHEYFNALSRYLLKRFSKVKDLDLIVAMAGISAMMVKKGAGDIEYHKLHPIVKAEGNAPAPGVTNPASPTGRQGPRKGK